MFGEMFYVLDHLAKNLIEQSHSFLHPRMGTIELLCAKKSFTDSAKLLLRLLSTIGGGEWFNNTCMIQ